jgi:uncharacterized membrane protein
MAQKTRPVPRKAALPAEQPWPGPAWSVAALAALGLLVALYLTWLKLTGTQALLCTQGSGCDLVQASRYGTLLWVPTAAWGALFYATMGGLALAGLIRTRWVEAFVLAAAGAGFSLYLTGVSFFVIRAACPYCLASTAIALALVGMLAWMRPVVAGGSGSTRWSRVAVQAGAAAVATVVIAAFIWAWPGFESSAEQHALAQHLQQTKAVMYGAYWCPACKEQKARFGAAASGIPYVECDPGGAGARPDLCTQVGVKAYPTWVIAGQKLEGVLTLDQLARLSGFPGASRRQR